MMASQGMKPYGGSPPAGKIYFRGKTASHLGECYLDNFVSTLKFKKSPLSRRSRGFSKCLDYGTACRSSFKFWSSRLHRRSSHRRSHCSQYHVGLAFLYDLLCLTLLRDSVGFFQEYRAEKTMDSLRQLSSPTAFVIRNGEGVAVPAKDLIPGLQTHFYGLKCCLCMIYRRPCDDQNWRCGTCRCSAPS